MLPPDIKYATSTLTPTITIGSAVDFIPSPRPPIIIVAEPVSLVSASFFVGLYVSDV